MVVDKWAASLHWSRKKRCDQHFQSYKWRAPSILSLILLIVSSQSSPSIRLQPTIRRTILRCSVSNNSTWHRVSGKEPNANSADGETHTSKNLSRFARETCRFKITFLCLWKLTQTFFIQFWNSTRIRFPGEIDNCLPRYRWCLSSCNTSTNSPSIST